MHLMHIQQWNKNLLRIYYVGKQYFPSIQIIQITCTQRMKILKILTVQVMEDQMIMRIRMYISKI